MLAKWEAPEGTPDARNVKEGMLLKIAMATGVLWPWLKHGHGPMWPSTRAGQALAALHPEIGGLLLAAGFRREAIPRLLQAGPRNFTEAQAVSRALVQAGIPVQDVDRTIIGAKASEAASPVVQEPAPASQAPPGYTALPVYSVKAAAGEAYENGSERVTDEVLFSTPWLQHGLRVDPERAAVVHVEGDSMEPVLASGDMVVVDLRPEARQGDGIFLLRHGEGLMVKSVQRLLAGRFQVISRNPAYRAYEVGPEDGEDLEILGRVACAVRRL